MEFKTKPTNNNLMHSKTCYICEHEMLRIKSVIPNPFNKSQRVVATYYECFKCGEIIFTEEESKKLKQLAKNNKITICTATGEECSDCTYSCENKLIKNK